MSGFEVVAPASNCYEEVQRRFTALGRPCRTDRVDKAAFDNLIAALKVCISCLP